MNLRPIQKPIAPSLWSWAHTQQWLAGYKQAKFSVRASFDDDDNVTFTVRTEKVFFISAATTAAAEKNFSSPVESFHYVYFVLYAWVGICILFTCCLAKSLDSLAAKSTLNKAPPWGTRRGLNCVMRNKDIRKQSLRRCWYRCTILFDSFFRSLYVSMSRVLGRTFHCSRTKTNRMKTFNHWFRWA